MQKLSWQFLLEDGTPLPNTTCWAQFKPTVTEQGAYGTALADLRTAATAVAKQVRGFAITHYVIVAFPTPPSLLKGAGPKPQPITAKPVQRQP
jgi:hypothetical protein